MITERDLEEAILECQGKRNPDASTCIKLAAFYTIRNELFPTQDQRPEPAYSYAPAPQEDDVVVFQGGSEFAEAVAGKRQETVWPVIDELMSTIKAIHPRLYDAVMAKL